ncbi:MAG: hypothetical protein JWP35_3411 [Caulobacter sp.]|nr:hypothetical protein [Caulobacter sp.]
MPADALAASDSLPSPGAPTSASPTRTAWSIIAMLALVLFGGAVMKSAFGPLQEAAKHDLGLSDFSISLIQGLGAGLPIAIFSLPLSWLIDHGNRIRLAIVLLGVCIAGTIWTSFAHDFYSFLAARTLSTIGAGTLLGALISVTADLCVPAKRGRALVLLGFGVYAGAALGFGLAGGILKAMGQHPIAILGAMTPWRQTHLLLGVAGAVLALPLIFMREPVRQEVEVKVAALGPVMTALWAKRKFLAPLFVGQIGITMADTAAAIWASPVLIRDFHQQPADFSGWIGLTMFAAGVLGSILGGVGADLGHRTGRRGGLLWAGVVATLVGIPAALFPIMPTVAGFGFLFFLLALHGAVASVMVTTAVVVLLPNEERGACSAAFGVINAIVGLSLAPIMVTLGAKLLGGEQHLGMALAITGVITGIAAAAGYILAMRNAPLAAAPGAAVIQPHI